MEYNISDYDYSLYIRISDNDVTDTASFYI